jgi:hypothetical protein
MQALLELLSMAFEFLLTVVLLGLRGELDVDDEGKGKKEPILYTPEETLESVDCKICGKPNPVEYVFCKACGELLSATRSLHNRKGGVQ